MLRDHSRQHQKWNLGMPCERQVPWYYLFGLVKKPFERIPITWGTNTCINKNNIFTAISRKNVVCHTLSRPRPRLALGRLMHQSRIIARLPVFSFKNNPAFILKISVHLDCHAEIQELDLTPSFQLLKAHCLGIHDLEHVKHFPVPAWNWFPAFRYISTMPQPLFTLTQFSFIYFIGMNVTQKTPEAWVRWSPGAWGLKGEICWRNAHDFLLLPFVIFLEGLGMAPELYPGKADTLSLGYILALKRLAEYED